MALHLNEAVLAAEPSAIRRFSRMAAETPGCIALTLGEPDFDTPSPVREAAVESLRRGETHYIANNGALELREAISEFERDRNGVSYAPEEIIVTNGATEGLFSSLYSLIEPGDEVLIPTPAFGLYASIVGLCRGIPRPIPTEETGFQPDPERIRAAITPRTKALVLNTPNNPTGCVCTPETIAAIADVVRAGGIYVLADDVYRQLSYDGPAASLSDHADLLREQLIIVQSFSKPYAMTGWRMGYLLCDRKLSEQIAKVHQYSVVSTSSISQRAAIEALRWDPAPMRETYRARRDYALSRLAAMGLETPHPGGAFYLFPSIARFGMSSEAFCTRMIREAGLAATPGSCFGGEGHIRLTYCYADPQLKEGLDRLERFLHELEG